MKLLSLLSAFFVFFSVITASAQATQLMIYWDESPACGRSNIAVESGAIVCGVEKYEGSSRFRSFDHGSISVSMSYWRFSDALRIVVVLENRSEKAIPVDVKMWNVAAFKSFESFEAMDKPLFFSRAEKPMTLFNRGEVAAASADADTSRLPTNEPLTISTTERRVYDPETKRTSIEKTTKIVPNNAVLRSPIELRGQKGASALKWTEVPAKTRVLGEVSFGTRRSAKFHLLSLSVNGSVYVYALKPLTK